MRSPAWSGDPLLRPQLPLRALRSGALLCSLPAPAGRDTARLRADRRPESRLREDRRAAETGALGGVRPRQAA